MRVGSVCYATEQGIGFLPKWFHDAGVIDEVMVFRHGSRQTHMEWYPPGTTELVGRPFNGPVVDAFLSRIDVLLQFETAFDDGFWQYCRERGVRTVCVPMYECWKPASPRPDKFICPSLLDQRDYFPGSPFLEVPVPPDVVWTQRKRARRFLHNGGNLGLRGHKGTLEILQAMKFVRSPITMTVRAQDTAGLCEIMKKILPGWTPSSTLVTEHQFGPARLIVDRSEVAHRHLFQEDDDVFVMAEKYNGLSLPLREAFASGMAVMTSDRFPMNEWLPRAPLIPVGHYTTEKVGGPYNTYLEAHVCPEDIATAVDGIYDANITELSVMGREWAKTNSWERLKPLWLEELAR